jgi:diguanylate cyclase
MCFSMTIETNTVADWHEAITAVSPAVAQVMAAVLQQHAEELAAHFYQVMMADPEAAPFLSHETVQSHLKPGIQRWMRVLFQGPGSDPKAVAALQRHVGDVHARADIPVGLVSRGMRLLKTRIRTLLVQSELDRQGLVDAVGYVGVLIPIEGPPWLSGFLVVSSSLRKSMVRWIPRNLNSSSSSILSSLSLSFFNFHLQILKKCH